MNNLWDIAIEKSHRTEDSGATSAENALFLVGGKNAGKTSIIMRFLDRSEAPKPTVALEYTYARRAKGHNMAKDIGHIWELGGGTWLSKLMDIPLNPDNLLQTGIMLVLDLSNPGEMWFTLETLLATARARIESIISEMRQSHPNIRETLTKRAWERLGEEVVDKSIIDPFLIPLFIVGSKYDLFQELDSEKRKVICKTLRFVAHTNGASLHFFSTHVESLMTRAKLLMTNHLFSTTPSKTLQTEYSKPLMIPAGLDDLASIGNVPLSDKDIGRVNARKPVELWKHCFTSYFPQTATDNPAKVDDPAKDVKYAEPTIDNLRAQKDDELERYRRTSERRAQKKAQDVQS